MENHIDINSLKSGDHKAYNKLFREFYVPLCNYAHSILRDKDEAEDMAQKAFCKLWDIRETVEIHSSIKSYLYRVVHNDCLNKIKQRNIHSEHNSHYAYEKETQSNSTESMLLTKELERQIAVIVENMPPRCREVFLLSRRQYLSYAEIAKQLNITTNTVETQIVKALKLLRIGLKEYI